MGTQRVARQRWLSVLARAEPGELETVFLNVAANLPFARLRAPEVGLVMARARAGGVGQRFNFGEVPVTRCSVRGPGGHIGHGYVHGRNKRQAELVACFDALLQDPDHTCRLLETVITPLECAQIARREMIRRKAAATRVEFFTLMRGE